MASYKTEIKNGIINHTLTFMDTEFTEEWKEENTFCQSSIEGQVMQAFPDLCDEDAKIIEELTSMDEDELLEALSELTDYEQSE